MKNAVALDELQEAASRALSIKAVLEQAILMMPPGVGPGQSRGWTTDFLYVAIDALDCLSSKIEQTAGLIEDQE